MTAERITYGLSEAAEQLSVSRKTIERLIRDGSLRSVRIGRRRLVTATDLRALVERE
ncbi:MAG: helix-turn-helix domain-containing protein [Chloroflexi bacterium]|nr:helix-turn-helix domain-containing protein [Chloroflexota bacterium]MDA1147796.1 helix-turn-helix domain-containing protein [Chloroflexota bacterium]